MQVSESGLDVVEPGPPLRPLMEDADFTDGMEQLQDHLAGSMDRLESGLAPGFWHAGSEFLHPDREEAPPPAKYFEASGAVRSVVLPAGFVLLMLAGAAVSAFVFADRFGRLVAY